MFASKIKKVLTIARSDDEGGDVTVTIRKLSARSLEKASDARQTTVATSTKKWGADLVKVLREETSAPKAAQAIDVEKARKDRYATYDRESVIVAGVDSWSLPVSVPDVLGDLDEATVKLLHESILDLSLPPIDPEELKAAIAKD